MKPETTRWSEAAPALLVAAALVVGSVGSTLVSSASAWAEERSGSTGSDRATDTRPDLSMEEIVTMLSERGLGEVYEVEREWDGYEVKIREPDGGRLKLYVDSKTGEILHEKREGEVDEEGDDE